MEKQRPSTGCSNLKCPVNGKQFRMTMRTSSSGFLHRTTPDYFKDSRIRTCSSIKLVDGMPKAVSFPKPRTASSRRSKDSLAKDMVTSQQSVYQ